LIYTAVKATVLTTVAVSSAVLASTTVIEIVEASKEIGDVVTAAAAGEKAQLVPNDANNVD
jgi:hypothetical protein